MLFIYYLHAQLIPSSPPCFAATNHMRWPLYALVGADAKGRGLPLALMLTSTERASPIVQMFQAIRAVAPNWTGRLARLLLELYFPFNNNISLS